MGRYVNPMYINGDKQRGRLKGATRERRVKIEELGTYARVAGVLQKVKKGRHRQ
jgi:hypothetical protein